MYTYNKSSTYSLRCGPQLHSHSLCLHLQPDTSESRWPLPSCPQQQNHRRGACEPAVVSSCLTRCQSPLSLNYTSNPVTYWESLLLLPRCFAVCMHNTRVVGGTSCQRGPWNPNSAAGKNGTPWGIYSCLWMLRRSTVTGTGGLYMSRLRFLAAAHSLFLTASLTVNTLCR